MEKMEKDVIELDRTGDHIVVTKKKQNTTLDGIFEGYDGAYGPVPFGWGEPAGREVW